MCQEFHFNIYEFLSSYLDNGLYKKQKTGVDLFSVLRSGIICSHLRAQRKEIPKDWRVMCNPSRRIYQLFIFKLNVGKGFQYTEYQRKLN